MRLNADCVRDVLLYLESNLGYHEVIEAPQLISGLSDKYSEEDILYSTEQLMARNWLVSFSMDNTFLISDILPPGHDFLANTRSLDIWEEMKTKMREKGLDAAIEVIGMLAKQIIQAKLGIRIP